MEIQILSSRIENPKHQNYTYFVFFPMHEAYKDNKIEHTFYKDLLIEHKFDKDFMMGHKSRSV